MRFLKVWFACILAALWKAPAPPPTGHARPARRQHWADSVMPVCKGTFKSAALVADQPSNRMTPANRTV